MQVVLVAIKQIISRAAWSYIPPKVLKEKSEQPAHTPAHTDLHTNTAKDLTQCGSLSGVSQCNA